MTPSHFRALRRRLVLAGGHPADREVAAARGRGHEPAIRRATLVEPPLRAIDPGPAERWSAPLAFLDGVQHTELLGYVGAQPLLGARVAAGVRRRVDRVPRAAVVRHRYLVVGRGDALAALGDLPAGTEPVVLADDEPPHPVGDLDRARALVDAARTALEIAVAAAFRRDDRDCCLLVDGTLTVSPDWSGDPHMVGIVKSHTTLPFEGKDLERYLTLPVGHRSSAFRPPSRVVAPVHAWGLRLWPWEGRDLLHGLVRVETAATEAALAQANGLARALMAERAPLAADPRNDRLLYGIHDVERWLRARSAWA
jgi:hypothetical protein